MARTLRLQFQSDGFRHGQVPLTILAEKLRALQNLIFHATATVTQDRLGRSGLWANRYRDVAELAFVASHHSDLVIEAELPELPYPRSLLAADVDRGERAVELVFAAGRAAIADGDLAALIRDREDRLRLLRAFELLCPAVAEGYQIELSNGAGPAGGLVFSADTRQKLSHRAAREQARAQGDEEETIVGQLTKIHVHTAPQLIALRVGHQEIQCYFDESMLDQVSNLVPGSLVEVTGWPVTDATGRKQINAITDVDTVSTEPLRLMRFEHEGTRYLLKEPLLVFVEYAEGVWVYRNEVINLWGYAKRRADALKGLGAAFDYLFREIALEDDAVLDGKALLLKQRLLALVGAEAEGTKGG